MLKNISYFFIGVMITLHSFSRQDTLKVGYNIEPPFVVSKRTVLNATLSNFRNLSFIVQKFKENAIHYQK